MGDAFLLGWGLASRPRALSEMKPLASVLKKYQRQQVFVSIEVFATMYNLGERREFQSDQQQGECKLTYVW